MKTLTKITSFAPAYFLVLSQTITFGAHIEAVWIGGTGQPEDEIGNWTFSRGEEGDPENPYRTNWAGGVIPGENDTDTYSVFIDRGNPEGSSVTGEWYGGISVRDLILDSDDSLTFVPSGSNNYTRKIIFGESGGARSANLNGAFSMTAGNSFDWGGGFVVNFNGDFTFGGSGTMTGTGTANLIQGGVEPSTLTLGSGLTVQGSMDINAGDSPLNIAAFVDANHIEGQSLLLRTNPGVAMTVGSGLTASDGGRLEIHAADLDLRNGSLTAEAGSRISLLDGLEISGGTLASTDTGYLETAYNYWADSQTVTLNEVNLTGRLIVQGTTELLLHNSNTISGTLEAGFGTSNARSKSARIVSDGNVSLLGSGTIRLLDDDYSIITGNNAENSLTLNSALRVEGQGYIGGNGLILNNAGTIDADADGPALTLDIPDDVIWRNTGTIEASEGTGNTESGTLYIDGAGTLDNRGGTIRAVGDSSFLQLSSEAKVIGGMLHGDPGADVELEGAVQDVILTGATVVPQRAILQASGTLTNNGTFTLEYGNSTSAVELVGDLILNGDGTTSVQGYSSYSRFTAADQTDYTLTIGSSHTVTGDGSIGAARVNIVNRGIITSAPEESTLYVSPKSGGNLINTGTLRADTSTLVVGYADVDSSGGKLEIMNGGRLNIDNGMTLDSNSMVSIELSLPTARLEVEGAAFLAGTLELKLDQDYTPSLGDSLTIVETASYTGNFANVILPTMPAGLSLRVDFSNGNLVAEVVEGDANPPTTFESWADEFEIPADRRDPLDWNGPLKIQNLMAYSMGLDPMNVTGEDMPKTANPDPERGVIHLIYRRAKNSSEATLMPKISVDLETWSNVHIVTETILEDGGTWEKVDATIELAPGGNGFFNFVAVGKP